MFKEIHEKIQKTNDQRMKMMFTLINVMSNTKESSLELRTAVAASMLEMLDTSMLPEDAILIQLIDSAIDSVCSEAENKGIVNMKESLRKIIKVTLEKVNHVATGDSILNNINLN